MDSQDLLPNPEPVECRICYRELQPGDGVLLRECLHCFCRWFRRCCLGNVGGIIMQTWNEKAWLNTLHVSRDSHLPVSLCLCVFLLRECLRSVIMLSEEPEVSCPYRDDTYFCTCSLQEREIRAVSSLHLSSLGWACPIQRLDLDATESY